MKKCRNKYCYEYNNRWKNKCFYFENVEECKIYKNYEKDFYVVGENITDVN